MSSVELTDELLLGAVRNSLDTFSLLLPGRRIGKLKKESELILKNALLLDFGNNYFEHIDDQLFIQFPEAWWIIFRRNNLKRLTDRPLLFVGLLDVSDNHLSLKELEPFSNSCILRLNISGNDLIQDTIEMRKQLLRTLNQVWVINDDFVKTEESSMWSSYDVNIHKGNWQIPATVSDKQRDMFNTILNEMPEKNIIADRFKLDLLLDDYTYQAYIHNSSEGTRLGHHDTMPIVNCNDILLMKHCDRLDLAVMLTIRIFFNIPSLVYKDTMERLLVPYMSCSAIKDVLRLPNFAISSIVCLIVRICRKELSELNHHSELPSKRDIPNLQLGSTMFSCGLPSRDKSGFRFLKGVRLFLQRDAPPPGTTGSGEDRESFSEFELEILRTLQEIPTKGTMPLMGSKEFSDRIPFIARHALVMMTKVQSCPPLTKCQTSTASQSTYNEMKELLVAASMTYGDLDISTNGPAHDGRSHGSPDSRVLPFGEGLPNHSYSSLMWNKIPLTREYSRPWAGIASSSSNAINSHDSHDITDLSVGDEECASSRSDKSNDTESHKIPHLVNSTEHPPGSCDDELSLNSATSSVGPKVDGQPWKISLKTRPRSESGAIESKRAHSPPFRGVQTARLTSPPKSPPKSIVSGYSNNADKQSQFVLAPSGALDDWKFASGKEWSDIQVAPVLVHPQSKYPVYVRRKGIACGERDCEILVANKSDWKMFSREREQQKSKRLLDMGPFHDAPARNELKESSPLSSDMMKQTLFKEMGTTRNIRSQRAMSRKLKLEMDRQRKQEEERKRLSYQGIVLLGGSSVMSHESFNTLETKSTFDTGISIDLNKVSWNSLLKNEGMPTDKKKEKKEKKSKQSDVFLTATGQEECMERPFSPSKAKLSHTPDVTARPASHAFRNQDNGLGWDPSVPLSKHVQRALRYSSVYTNSEEIDWGTVLTSGRSLTTWFPRHEKFTYTLAELAPVEAARLSQLELTPNSRPPPPPQSSICPLPSKAMVLAPETNASLRQRSARPDRSRGKHPPPSKRVTAPALTTNFVNRSLAQREPIYMEVLQVEEASSSSSTGQLSLCDTDYIMEASNPESAKSSPLNKDHSTTLSIEVGSSYDELHTPQARDMEENDSVGSASLSCGSHGSFQRTNTSRRRRENLSMGTSKSHLNDRSSHAVPVLNVPPNPMHRPSLKFTKRKQPALPRVLAQVDPAEASFAKFLGGASSVKRDPLSICRPVSNKLPINPSFKMKKPRRISKETMKTESIDISASASQQAFTRI